MNKARIKPFILVFLLLALFPVYAGILNEMSGEEKRKALNDPPLQGWIYEDLQGAINLAKKENKPLMVVFR